MIAQDSRKGLTGVMTLYICLGALVVLLLAPMVSYWIWIATYLEDTCELPYSSYRMPLVAFAIAWREARANGRIPWFLWATAALEVICLLVILTCLVIG